MSARPWPVTSLHYARNSLSEPCHSSTANIYDELSSSGCSTESLISVLDHDSYQSPTSDDFTDQEFADDGQPESASGGAGEEGRRISLLSSSGRTTSSDPSRARSVRQKTASGRKTWLEWVVGKEKKAREMTKLKTQAEENNAEYKKRLEKHREWLKDQNEKLKLKKKEEKEKTIVDKKSKEEEEKRKTVKREEEIKKTKKWSDEKKKQVEEESAKEKEKQEKKRKEREDKLEKIRQNLKNKPRRNMKTTEKIDFLHYPEPEFYNPIPWRSSVPTSASAESTGLRRGSQGPEVRRRSKSACSRCLASLMAEDEQLANAFPTVIQRK